MSSKVQQILIPVIVAQHKTNKITRVSMTSKLQRNYSSSSTIIHPSKFQLKAKMTENKCKSIINLFRFRKLFRRRNLLGRREVDHLDQSLKRQSNNFFTNNRAWKLNIYRDMIAHNCWIVIWFMEIRNKILTTYLTYQNVAQLNYTTNFMSSTTNNKYTACQAKVASMKLYQNSLAYSVKLQITCLKTFYHSMT